MRCPNKKVVGVLVIVVVILIATVLSVVNSINIFGSTETSKNNDKNSFENSPHSTSTNLHVVLTGSVVGIIILIVAMIVLRIMASKDRNSSNALEVERELTNRARLEPLPPHLTPTPWYPTAPIPHKAPHVIHQAIPSHPQM